MTDTFRDRQPALGARSRVDLDQARRLGYLITRDPAARAGEFWRDHCRRRRIPWLVVILGATSAKIRIDLEPAGRTLAADAGARMREILCRQAGRRWQASGGRTGWRIKGVPVDKAEEIALEIRRMALECGSRREPNS